MSILQSKASYRDSSKEGFQAADGVESTGGGNSASTTPNRKRPYSTSFISDDEVPPNKRIHTPTEEEKETLLREKQILYKRLLDSEKNQNPFLLSYSQSMFPFLPLGTKRMSPVSPVYSFLQHQQSQKTQLGNSPYHASLSPRSSGILVPTPTGETNLGPANIQSSSAISGLPTPGSSVGSSSTPPRATYPPQLLTTANFLKYPFSPPTPSSLSSLSLLSPWSNSNINGSSTDPGSKPNSQEEKRSKCHSLQKENSSSSTTTLDHTDSNTDPDEIKSSRKSSVSQSQSTNTLSQTKSTSGGLWSVPSSIPQPPGVSNASTPSMLGALSNSLSNPSNFMPVQSPMGYFHHPSPLSPMMLLNSPYASSLPSTSSSSGCSSVSDNSGPPGSVSSQNQSYAPSEYHVGPRRPLGVKIAEEFDNQSEGASNSGRNTPIDVGMENNAVLSDEVSGVALAQRLVAASSATPGYKMAASTDRIGAPPRSPSNVSVVNSSSRGQLTKNHQTPYPFSVESLSSSVNPQGYIGSVHLADRPSSGVSSMSSSVSSRDSTPEPDEMKHHSHPPGVGCDTFCLVPGRLSLLSSTQKYQVPVDEVRRRLSHPECLNASVLGGILRRAKSKNGGHVLRQRLESIGVTLPPGRRKATDLSLFTSLVEGEALHLANDFHRLCDTSFPHAELAQIIASQHTGTPEAQHRVSMVKATQLIVSELQAMVNAVGGPSNIRPNDPNNPYPGLINFSLLTHGFGNPTINTSLNALQTYLQDLLGYYEGTKPLQSDTRYMFANDKVSTPTTQPNTHPSHSTIHPQHTGGVGPSNAQYSVYSSSSGTTVNNTSSNSGNEGNVDNVHRNRSGLFVCLKQEPSD